MKKKFLPVIIAIVLILIIGAVGAGSILIDKYSYSRERADLDEYFGASAEGVQRAIVLQDDQIEEKAVITNGLCYFDLATVHKYLNETFYADRAEGILLYTTPDQVIRAGFGETGVQTAAGTEALGYVPVYLENDTVYVAADYVKRYTDIAYEVFERQVQLYTQPEGMNVADVRKKTAVRLKGGVKSPILRDLAKGEQVEILEEMETWIKVKTSDSIIGYVERKRLSDIREEEQPWETGYVEPEYTSIALDGKVNLGFHAIGGTAGNDTLDTMAGGAKGLNVVAPTWFSLNDNEGNFRSFGTAAYVQRAHALGMQVWGVLDDFNYNNETNAGIDVYGILSSTTKRQYLVGNITQTALSLGLDGINIDFEKVGADSGEHFVQFLRELSIQCRANGLVLSVDNYVPFNFNDYYRLDIQGKVVDYVIIMGYDEHWHGSQEPGSVASISYVSDGLDKTLAEVPAGKVINALPLYTIVWKTEGTTVTDEYLTMRNTADFISRVGIQPEWDDTTCQNYAEWSDGSAQYQLWVEDEQSVSAKLGVMAAKNIGGVAVWRLGYGTPAAWELIDSYARGQ